MFITDYKTFKEIIFSKDFPIELKVHIFEGDVSELFYKFWCWVTNGKFDRKPKKKRNTCTLVTKRGFHPISSLLVGRLNISPTELEVYERNCLGNRWGTSTKMYWYGKWSNSSKCEDCGKSFAVQEDDTKIVGKFYAK